MSGNRLLLDSNILIYLSKNELRLDQFAMPEDTFHISVITLMEVKGFPFYSIQEEEFINQLCDLFEIDYIDEDIVNEVIKIRKKHRIKLPDAIILSSAIVNNCVLITHNADDFKNFSGVVSVRDPFIV